MKRILGTILSLSMVLSLAACGGGQPAPTAAPAESAPVRTAQPTAAPTETPAAVPAPQPEPSPSPLTQEEKEQTEVRMTMPAVIYRDVEDAKVEEQARQAGYQEVIFNDDFSVTFVMNLAQREAMQVKARRNMDENIRRMVAGTGEEKVPSFVDIRRNEDLTRFDIYVDRDLYEEWQGFAALALMRDGVFYQIISGADHKDICVTYNMIDSRTDEVFDTDDMNIREFSSLLQDMKNGLI